MGKLIVVSNRLPVTVQFIDGNLECKLSTGGLATGLAKLMEQDDTVWVGWHGCSDTLDTDVLKLLHCKLREEKLEAIDLSTDEIRDYYNEVSNAVLWPTYHYQLERIPLDLTGWDSYQAVNQRFADRIIELYEEGDFIWVHDYHLQLVPALIRNALPHARIGFFLHIPFPSVDVFRVLPWREHILNGILGADVIGFHTYGYVCNFESSLLRVAGVETRANTVQHDGRVIKIGAFPLGVDLARISEVLALASSELADSVHRMKQETQIEKVMLAVDRMDYTKGLPRRLLALERLLRDNPDLRGKVVLIQIAAPSRDNVPAYENYRKNVERLIGQINGKYGMPGYQPIHYVSRGYSQDEIFSLYRLVDILLVTPLRDGMNLVAKEFVATRADLDGVLILSEFAGAASELGEALQVNPYDTSDMAAGMLTAIRMPREERTQRMKSLRNRVTQFDASGWARRFIDYLHAPVEADESYVFVRPSQLAEHVPRSERIVLMLDYDGTLFPIVRFPELARPDTPLIKLLKRMSMLDCFEIHILSGRPRETLEAWFPIAQLHLHAEHGAFSRSAGASEWSAVPSHSNAADWQPFVRSIMEEYCNNTPGSFIEDKAHSLVWHYRMADPVQGDNMAKMLRSHAREAFPPMGLEVLPSKRAIEVRQMGVNKGLVISRVLKDRKDEIYPIAIGDDVTDEDMFQLIPASGMTVMVGGQKSSATFRLRDPAEVRLFLEGLASLKQVMAV